MLAYHVKIVPWSRVTDYLVELTACLFVWELAVVVLRYAALIVKHPIHYLLDWVPLHLLLVVLLIDRHTAVVFAFRSLLDYNNRVIESFVLQILCLGNAHVGRSLILLDDDWLVQRVLALRLLLGLVCVESLAKVDVGRGKARIVLQLLPEPVLTAFWGLLLRWLLIKDRGHVSSSLKIDYFRVLDVWDGLLDQHVVGLNRSATLEASDCVFFSVIIYIDLCDVDWSWFVDWYGLQSLVTGHLDQTVLFDLWVILSCYLLWGLVYCKHRCWINTPPLICFNIVEGDRPLWRDACTWLVFFNQLGNNLDIALADYDTLYFLFSTVSSCILRRSRVWSFWANLRH